MICSRCSHRAQELVVDGAIFVAGAERGRGLVFVGGGALVVVGGTGYANNRGWQPMGGECWAERGLPESRTYQGKAGRKTKPRGEALRYLFRPGGC